MTFTITLFAAYAEVFGRPQIDLRLSPGATVGDMIERIRARADASGLPDRPLVAVNQEYASYDRVLEAGDEVALIPPVAGG
jgi:molybdopterin converting factor subunit 1